MLPNGEKELKSRKKHYDNMVNVAESMVPRGKGPLSVSHALHEKKEEVTEILGYENHHGGVLPKRLLNRFKNMR